MKACTITSRHPFAPHRSRKNRKRAEGLRQRGHSGPKQANYGGMGGGLLASIFNTIRQKGSTRKGG